MPNDNNPIALDRTSAITPANRLYLQQLGVWQDLLPEHVTPYRNMHLWQDDPGRAVHIDARDHGLQHLGYITANAALQRSLWRTQTDNPNIQFFQSQAVAHQAPCLQLASQESLQAPLIVGADGAHSWLRQHAGINHTRRSYRQSALIAQVEATEPHNGRIWQRFLATGPLALLPFGAPHQYAMVWSSNKPLPTDPCTLTQRLNDATSNMPGLLKVLHVQGQFPLQRAHANTYVRDGMVLVGDAAHTVHPLAGLGANLGLYDAQALTTTLCALRARKRQWNLSYNFAAFQRQAIARNQLFLNIIDLINRLYTTQSKPTRHLGAWALRLTQASTCLKQRMVAMACQPEAF